MSRYIIVVVIVICQLCIKHLSCMDQDETIPSKDVFKFNSKNFHIKDSSNIKTNSSNNYNSNKNSVSNNKRNYNSEFNTLRIDLNKSKNKRKDMNSLRHKRHSTENNMKQKNSPPNLNTSNPKITDNFIEKIFNEYGKDGTIDSNGFNRMLTNLNLYKLIEHKTDDSSSFNSNENNNDTCITMEELLHKIKPKMKIEHQESPCKLNKNSSSDSNRPCDPTTINDKNINTKINNWDTNDIYNLCPIFLYHLSVPSRMGNFSCIHESMLMDIEIDEITSIGDNNTYNFAWIYAFLAVLGCSGLGLVGVAIIPCMDTWYFKDVLQFLVSVAVGTMAGDALLHLLPHAIAGNNETQMVYKGLICMGGIIFFYATEHTLNFVNEWRNASSKKENHLRPNKVFADKDTQMSPTHGDNMSKSKNTSYAYSYNKMTKEPWTNSGTMNKISRENVLNECKETVKDLLVPNSNQIADGDGNSIPLKSLHLDNNSMSISDGNSNSEEKIVDNIKDHVMLHHGHSHTHSHSHNYKHSHSKPPETLSAIAWMIILGDGFHNFTDGMAIGAAFSEGLAGGFSTSLAVFCHELPHELGDFAILIRAGMSTKSALCYNFLTGILSFVGMAFGIVFGQSHECAQWMFAAAAGLFIYIALVDMMPELASARTSLRHCVLQVFGMLVGLMLMFLIALYEHDLMTTFTSNDTDNINISHKHDHN